MKRRQVLVLVTQSPMMGDRVLGEELNGVDDPLALAGYKQPKQALADGWRLCGPPVIYDDGSLHNGYEWYFEREEPGREPFADAFAVTVDGAVYMLAESEDDALAQRDRWRAERPEVINAVSVHMTIGRTLERDDA